MASIKKFEDLVCWQRARQLANEVFNLTDKSQFKDFDLKRQVRRAAVSPMSNIAEGFDRATRNEFIDALYIAKGEVGEVRSQTYLAFDRKYINQSELESLLKLTDECSRLIQSFAYKVKGGSRQGIQFKTVKKADDLDELINSYIDK
ncbi:MAG: four helix bundle protein [Patescibacteria group bacterium]